MSLVTRGFGDSVDAIIKMGFAQDAGVAGELVAGLIQVMTAVSGAPSVDVAVDGEVDIDLALAATLGLH